MASISRKAALLSPLPLALVLASAAAAQAPDPRASLRPGLHDAGEAAWNLRVLSKTPVPQEFAQAPNSDLAFTGRYAIQGNFAGWQIWDISNPASPVLTRGFVCPASQSDVSVYRNLLFVSGESLEARLDCGTEGPQGPVSPDRLRGLRIFDITDIRNPRIVGNVQTCRGSHTHTVVEDPNDRENVYVYISGSAPIRPEAELAGCVGGLPDSIPQTALFRIEVIKVPLANPERAAIVSSPRIFTGLTEAPSHGEAAEDVAEAARVAAEARARGEYTAVIFGTERVAPSQFVQPMLDSIVAARGGTGAPTAADSAALRASFQDIVDQMIGADDDEGDGPRPGPTQCHDITVYTAIGLAGGACEGYGFLLDISDPVNPRRIAAAADSNFAYWHSATFNNDGTKVLFSDEWGGGSAAKCRATDRREWGANALFTITPDRQMRFASYYKLPVAQRRQENCVAHNGSPIPIPGRDVMVQAWYQGGISVFDWTDPARPTEIAYFDRGPASLPADSSVSFGGSWSAYWYNGVIVSSEIARGLDILELTPSEHLSQNEIDAAKTVRLEYLNVQSQPRFVWPASFALARAYVDQLERSRGLSAARVSAIRQALSAAEGQSGGARSSALHALGGQIEGDAAGSSDAAKVRLLAGAVHELAGAR